MASNPKNLYIDDVVFMDISTMGTYNISTNSATFTLYTTPYEWTYSGSGTFLGFSLTEGSNTADTNLSVGDSGNLSYIYNLESGETPVYLYSVTATSTPVEISYNNTTVASLSIPGSYAYLETAGDWIEHDIIIECDPTSPNQVIVSTYNYDDEEIDTVYTATSEGTLTLDTEEAWTPYNIKVFYGEPPPAPGITIDGTSYNVDANTAYWYEWVDSNYAPSGSGIEMDPTGSTYFVHLGGTASNYGIFYNGSLQSPGDEIVIGYAYTTGAAYEQHDLTGTTWYFNSSLNYPFTSDSYSLNFTSNGGSYTTMSFDDYSMYYGNPMVTVTAYGPQSGPPAWSSQNYRTISISGGADATNAALYAFISSNATQQ